MRLMFTFLLALAGTPALAQSTEADVLRCAAQPDGVARLACFDALAARLRAAPAAAPTAAAPTPPVAVAPPPVVTQEQQVAAFGAPQISAADELASLDSRIDGLLEGWQGGSVFILANGQRWMVADGSSAVLYLKSPKVSIKRAALGGFRIEFEGSNQTARVKRL